MFDPNPPWYNEDTVPVQEPPVEPNSPPEEPPWENPIEGEI